MEDLFTKEFDLGSIELKVSLELSVSGAELEKDKQLTRPQVDFLDTSGSMQFPAMRRLSITTGSAFLIVYALDDPPSYEVLKMCVAEIREIRPDYQVSGSQVQLDDHAISSVAQRRQKSGP